MPQYWFVVEALAALYAHLKASRTSFTRDQLKTWSPPLQERPSGAQHALDHLERCAMVRRLTGTPAAKPLKRGAWRYQLTAEGAAAAKAACDARARAAMSRSCTLRNNARPRDKAAFAARLWALLRMRTTLTAAEAAATLADAGTDVAKATRTASTYLRSWVRLHPRDIQVSARRESSGAYRFVLVHDLGPAGPVISDKRLQERAAA